jgi:hypothetical protein
MARIQYKNLGSFSKNLERQLYELMARKVPNLSDLATAEMTKTYHGEFGKDPIDSGKTEKQSEATVDIQKRPSPYIRLTFEVAPDPSRAKSWSKGTVADYAIFFFEPLQPKNPNYKYGKRNTVVRARDNTAKKLGLYNK